MSTYTTVGYKWMPKRQRCKRFLAALSGLVLTCMLALMGCDSSDSDNFAPATAADLSNRSFPFASGAAFGLDNASPILTFGNFDTDSDGIPNTGPFTLTSASGTATGTVTVASCNLAISSSTFNAALFPGLQPQMTVPLDPCAFDSEATTIRVHNPETGATSTSEAATVETGGVAFVLTTDFSTGSASVIDLATRGTFNDVVQQGSVHSDALARVANGFVYVVNRLGQDNITRLDPQQGYRFMAQQSVGKWYEPARYCCRR